MGSDVNASQSGATHMGGALRKLYKIT